MFVVRPCVLVLIFTQVTATAGGAVNYCGAKMCENVDTHTLCMYPPGPGPGCSGYIDADLSGEEKLRIVARLNRRRSEAAQGMGNMPPAANMLKLRWVEELAREAKRWADQCIPAQAPELHDECRDLYSVTVGQCVASIVGEAPGLRPESLVDMWHIQSLHYNWNVTFVPDQRKLPHEQADWHVEKIPAKETHFYGDFAQMVWAKTYMVGCGRSRFMAPWRDRLRSVERLVCNFAPQGPTGGNALWAPGPAASACPVHSRPDPDLPALCTFPQSMEEFEYTIELSMDTIEDDLRVFTTLEIEANQTLNYIGSLDESYLTKLAMATIIVPETTPYGFQKTDLLERTHIDILSSAEIKTTQTTTSLATPIKIFEKIKKMKLSLVGRPKPYDIDDLNDAEVEKYTANDGEKDTEEIQSNDKEFYDDYLEINTKLDDGTYSVNPTAPVYEHYQANTAEITSVVQSTTENSYKVVKPYEQRNETPSIIGTSSAYLTTYPMSKNSNYNISTETLLRSEEEYLSDPETLKQLQDALDRMEKEQYTKETVKVRREARAKEDNKSSFFPPGKNFYPILSQNPRAFGETPVPSTMRSMTIPDQRQIIKMVLRNVPYLRQYERTLLGNLSVGVRGSNVALCVVIFVSLNL